MGDWLLLLGGAIFIVLAIVSYFRPDLIWRLYSLEPRWRKDNPERTPAWDASTRRNAFYFLIIGAIFIVMGL